MGSLSSGSHHGRLTGLAAQLLRHYLMRNQPSAWPSTAICHRHSMSVMVSLLRGHLANSSVSMSHAGLPVQLSRTALCTQIRGRKNVRIHVLGYPAMTLHDLCLAPACLPACSMHMWFARSLPHMPSCSICAQMCQ